MQNDWGHLFHEGWWAGKNHKVITERVDPPELRVSFIHRLEHHRDAALRDDTLIVYFRNAGANDRGFIDAFNRVFYDRQSSIEGFLPEATVVTERKRNLLEARYDILTDEHDDFFEAYIDALARAVIDLALANEGLVEAIGEVYEEALGDYR